jgi:hypothetical protein
MNENAQLIINVTAGNLRNSRIYITGHHDFFPSDCVGGANRRSYKSGGSPIKIKLDGLDFVVETDIARDGRTGKPRKELRNRSAFGSFFVHHHTQPGDQLLLRRISARENVLARYKTVFQVPDGARHGTCRGKQSAKNSLELFVGGGGLAIGSHNAGFLRRNKSQGVTAAADWEIVEGDDRMYHSARPR